MNNMNNIDNSKGRLNAKMLRKLIGNKWFWAFVGLSVGIPCGQAVGRWLFCEGNGESRYLDGVVDAVELVTAQDASCKKDKGDCLGRATRASEGAED